MKVLTIDPKQPKKLMFNEQAIPTPQADEVLIKVKAASLNHRDLYIYNGWKSAEAWDEFIMGGDGSGVIVQVGEHVTNWQPGDEVIINPLVDDRFIGGPNNGMLTEFAVIQQEHLFKKPNHLDFNEAGSLTLALSTAWKSLFIKGRLQKGDTVLLQGIGGGVALIALDLALAAGANVIVTSSSDSKLNQAINMGATAGINYKTENVPERVMQITENRGVDLVLDSSGKDSIHASIASLAQDGRVVVFGSTTGAFDISYRELIKANAEFIVSGMGSNQEVADALAFYERHQLRPTISSIYTFDEVEQAILELAQEAQFGKIVIEIDN